VTEGGGEVVGNNKKNKRGSSGGSRSEEFIKGKKWKHALETILMESRKSTRKNHPGMGMAIRGRRRRLQKERGENQ